MKTRKIFTDWKVLSALNEPEIDTGRFFNINEKQYVFNILETLSVMCPSERHYIEDFKKLEIERYRIYESQEESEPVVLNQLYKGINFCAQNDDQKKKGVFKINPLLMDYHVTTEYLWDDLKNGLPQSTPGNYLFIPSFLGLAPQELCLVDLNSILLDLIAYNETFSFSDLSALVREALQFSENETNDFLLAFISNQVLYHRTMLLAE